MLTTMNWAFTTEASYLGPDAMEEFKWLVILGGFVCFAMAWGIGANDVANAFGTSVGAKAVTLKQATVLAGIFEFVGAIGLGSAVTSTVRKGITDYNAFIGEEDLLMLGMFCALVSAAAWLAIATKYSLPVSTTQSIVGAIAGFSFVAKGSEAVSWDKIIEIIIFWFATPLLAAIGCVTFFLPLRTFLLRRTDSYQKTLLCWPFFVFIVAFVMVFFLLVKGLKRLHFDAEAQLGLAFAITAGCAGGCAIIAYFLFICSGVVDKQVTKHVAEMEQKAAKQKDHDIIPPTPTTPSAKNLTIQMGPTTPKSMSTMDKEDPKNMSGYQLFKTKSLSKLTKGVNVDIHDDLEQLEVDIQENSEKFDVRTEKAFAWLQVCTASLGAFAHGSNDVANAVAPFAAMLALYENGAASDKTHVPAWVLGIGAIGIVFGLGTYGYKIIKCLGVRMAGMSSTRGYCIELSSALTIIIASWFGMPASTTHAQVGATVGVGLLELGRKESKLSWKKAVNWKLLMQVFLGWIGTLVVAGGSCAALYLIFAHSPYAGDICRD